MTVAAPWVALPLPPDPSSGRAFVVTSSFGSRDGAHVGIDLATRDELGDPTTGVPVFAVLAGTIVRTPDDYRGGTMVVLQGHDGTEVKYAHLSRRDVFVGEAVAGGQVLGLSGVSGQVRGPHLHLEHWHDGRDGPPMDPRVHLDALAAAAAAPSSGTGALVVGGLGLGLGLFLLSRRKR
jgi:murein DD-endopeptidase MepM/ murein hydrolase activator NlpD